MDAQEFKDKREKMRLTQKELAARLDVTENSIWRWETGRGEIPRMAELALKALRMDLLVGDAKNISEDGGSSMLRSVVSLAEDEGKGKNRL